MILDMAGGLLLAVAIGILTNVKLKLLFVGFGLGAALFPDIDAIFFFYQRKWKFDKFGHEHRDGLHYPVLVSLVGGFILFLFLDFSWALTWFSVTLFHFIHDTHSDGWGIKWLFPFDFRYFTLVSYSPKKIISNKKEQRRIAAKYGDPDWFRKSLRINREMIFEFLFLLCVLGLALWWLFF